MGNIFPGEQSHSVAKPLPIQQIDEIIRLARQYVGEVVRANVPSVPGAELDPILSTLLRPHRESCGNAGSELMTLKERLSKMNCDFVLDGEIAWSLDVLDWETKIWGPLQRWVQRGYAMLFEKRQGAIWPVRIPERDLRDWQQEGQAIEGLLKDRKVIFCPDDVVPVISKTGRSFRWKGDRYDIPGKKPFELFVLLVRNAGRSVPYLTISLELSSLNGMSDDAIHQTVFRLKQRLPTDLRTCLHNGQKKVRLDLPQPVWCS